MQSRDEPHPTPSALPLVGVDTPARARKLLHMARMRTLEIGPTARPIAVPEDLDDPSLPKATGLVEATFNVRPAIWTSSG